jgi:hypothetical protein
MVETFFTAMQILSAAVLAALVGIVAAWLSKRRWLGWLAAGAVVICYIRLWYFTDPP